MGFTIATSEEEDKEALTTFKSNMYDTPSNQEELDNNHSIGLARIKDTMMKLPNAFYFMILLGYMTLWAIFHYNLNSNNPADMLTKGIPRSMDVPLWKFGPEILRHPGRWHMFKPTKANVDAIPIFCGHTFTRDRPGYLPDPEQFDDLKDLLSVTINSLCLNLHLYLDNDNIIRIKTSLSNCENLL